MVLAGIPIHPGFFIKTRSHSSAFLIVLINLPTTIQCGNSLKLKPIIRSLLNFLALPNPPTTTENPQQRHLIDSTTVWPRCMTIRSFFSATSTYPAAECQAIWATAYLDRQITLPSKKCKRRSLSLMRRTREDTLTMATEAIIYIMTSSATLINCFESLAFLAAARAGLMTSSRRARHLTFWRRGRSI